MISTETENSTKKGGGEMTKEYIKELYRLALIDHKTAANQEAKNKALDELARLTKVATDIYGFDFADELRKGVA